MDTRFSYLYKDTHNYKFWDEKALRAEGLEEV